jgi:death-on-curing protein
LVQSAIARPYDGYHRSIAGKAAALVESVSRNHGFADGNKRTSLILLTLLLTRSGFKLLATNEEAENMVVDVVTKQLTFNELVAWFRVRIRKT